MIEPPFTDDELLRLESLSALRILDTAPEERFDRITRMAKRVFNVPICLISLVDRDRQWFKSAQGLEATQTPRNISFCGHAILGDEVFCIPDALKDSRFHDNPLVTGEPHIRFYAGSPLRAANGEKLGTLCLIDRKARELDEEDRLLLNDLAVMVEQEIAALQLATLDELTLISNRRGFNILAEHSMSTCRRHGWDATLLLFDLDGFKAINDQYGHAEGDRALRAFAALLQEAFRESDVFARIGGDEFAVLVSKSGPAQLESVLQRFLGLVNAHNAREKRGYELDYSVGVAGHRPEETLDSLLARADKAMYVDKQSDG